MSENNTLAEGIAEYLHAKRSKLSEHSRRAYKATLKKLAEDFPASVLSDFAAPSATKLLKEFLDRRWGDLADATYNGNLSVIQDFFVWHARAGTLSADRASVLTRRKEGRTDREAIERPLFHDADREAILRANPDVRDRVPLRLVIDFGVRKGALRNLRFGDCDRGRHQLTLNTRGGETTLAVPDTDFWEDLDQLRANAGATDDYFVLPRRTKRTHRHPRKKEILKLGSDLDDALMRTKELATELKSAEAAIAVVKLEEAIEFFSLARDRAFTTVRILPTEASGEHGTHLWWYECLRRAGLVEQGQTSGQAMQKGRHTAGKRILDSTGGDFGEVAKVLGTGVRTARITYAQTPADSLDAAMQTVRRQLDEDATKADA